MHQRANQRSLRKQWSTPNSRVLRTYLLLPGSPWSAACWIRDSHPPAALEFAFRAPFVNHLNQWCAILEISSPCIVFSKDAESSAERDCNPSVLSAFSSIHLGLGSCLHSQLRLRFSAHS